MGASGRYLFFESTSSILLLSILFLQIIISQAAHVFDVYRLIQFDKNGQHYGSRRAIVNHVAQAYQGRLEAGSATPRATAAAGRRGDFARRVIVVHVRELSTSALDDIDGRGAAGLLIVLPSDISTVPLSEVENWKILERHLLSREWEMPVYFAFDKDNISDMLAALVADKADSGDRYQLSVNVNEPTAIPTVTAHNFQGVQHGNGNEVEKLPTIAIVASYDSFGAAPGIAMGVDWNGSGTIAVLEAARIFGRLYSEFRTHGSYNLLFVLTGAGRFNYSGARHWLRLLEPRVLESLEFVLCIEGIGGFTSDGSSPLYLHTSKPGKTSYLQQFFDNFQQTADEMNIPFNILQRKINVSDPQIYWEHEHFARKKLIAATLSSSPVSSQPPSKTIVNNANSVEEDSSDDDLSGTPANKNTAALLGDLTHVSIFDRREVMDSKILQRNIKFVVEALCKQIYSFTGRYLNVSSHSLQVSEPFVNAWLEFLGSQPRVVPFLTKDSSALKQIEAVLQQHTTETKKTAFALDTGFSFYQSPVVTEMLAHRVKTFMFDVYLALGIIVYLALIHLYCKGHFSISKKQ